MIRPGKNAGLRAIERNRTQRAAMNAASPISASKRLGGKKIGYGAVGLAVMGAGAYTAFKSARRVGQDMNNSLGNPASFVTGWSRYNRSSRGL